MPTFGEWLRAKRTAAKMSQEDLGEAVGVSKTQISRLESGQQTTKNTTLVKIFQALKISAKESKEGLALMMAAQSGDEFKSEAVADIPEQILEYIKDPDVQELIFYYGGTPEDMRAVVKNTAKRMKTAADFAREEEDKYTIGKRADRPESEPNDPDIEIYRADDD